MLQIKLAEQAELIDNKIVAAYYKVSRKTLWVWANDVNSKFPKPLQLGERKHLYVRDELIKYNNRQQKLTNSF